MPTIDGIRFALLTSALAGVGVGACAGAREPQLASPPPVAVVDVPPATESEPDLDAGATAVLAQSDAGGSARPEDEPEALDDPAAERAALGALMANDGGAFSSIGRGSATGILGLVQMDGGTGFGFGGIGLRLRDGGAAKVGVGGTRVRGSLDKDVIRRIVRRHLPAMRVCYEKELAKDAQLQAKVAPRFVIGADGRVATVSISHGSGNAALDACLERAIQRMVFPRPKGGGVVVVTYPFVFTPSP